MTPNPFLDQIRHRMAVTGGWSRLCFFPQAQARQQPPKRVFVLERENRRFAVVAKNLAEADTRLTATLAIEA